MIGFGSFDEEEYLGVSFKGMVYLLPQAKYHNVAKGIGYNISIKGEKETNYIEKKYSYSKLWI